MAYEKTIAKAGMEGRTTRTERWGHRVDIKKAAKKQRRRDDAATLKEQR